MQYSTVRRLSLAGYGCDFVSPIILRLLKCRDVGRADALDERKVVCLPYFHDVSHHLKALAGKFGVTVVLKPNFRLDWLTPFLAERSGCSKNYREPSVSCVTLV